MDDVPEDVRQKLRETFELIRWDQELREAGIDWPG